MSAPATHKQPSRKGKKAWRKNVDLTEVQSGLDSTRTELLQGGIIAERPSSDLFTTDTAGDAETARKQASGPRLLKADEILAQRSAIAAIPKRKRKDEVSSFEGSGPGGKKRKNGEYVSYKDLRRLKMIADGQAVGLAMEGEKAAHDPWGAVEKDPVQEEKFSFLEPVRPKVAPKTLGQAPNAITKDGKAVKSVRKPEAGKSYNPNVVDWTSLYEREGAAAVEKEKARLAAEAETEAREQAALEEAARVEAAEKEAFAADYESAWESEWEGIQSGAEDGTVVHTKKMQKRKTPAERNKIRARKEREQKEKWEKKQKIRAEQEKHIKKIARDLAAKDKAKHNALVPTEDNDDSSSDDGQEVAIVKRRFGKVGMPEAPLEVTLPEDLEDTLRRLKPEGNLLTDRYRNLLMNGKVEIRKPVGQRKQKQVYRTEKWSYKDWELK